MAPKTRGFCLRSEILAIIPRSVGADVTLDAIERTPTWQRSWIRFSGAGGPGWRFPDRDLRRPHASSL